MQIHYYISGHGLGHASRSIEIIRALTAAAPDVRVVVRTSAPEWFFESAGPACDVQRADVDTGVVQFDSLRIDAAKTLETAAAFYREFDRRADADAERLSAAGADLVVGDIPPLAFAAAARAGIRSLAVGNFTWDWIYGAYPAFAEEAPHVVPTIRAAYDAADVMCRLPFHGGFDGRAPVEDVPLVARHSVRDRADTRRRLGIPDGRPAVLASFGAYGAPLPESLLGRSHAFTFLSFDRRPPGDVSYEDVVAAVDVVVSKPGYGIVSDCVANDTALLYTSRGAFAEYDVFVSEMPRVLRCRYIDQHELVSGRWERALDALLRQPLPPERWRIDGAAVIATRIVEIAARDRPARRFPR